MSFAVLATLAVACGGGGGGGSGSPPPAPTSTPPASPSPTPTPVPTNNSYRPTATGDTFAYSGTLVETFVRPPLARAPIPSPNPTSTQTLSYAVTQTTTVAAGATFGTVSNAYDFKTNETDVLAGGLKTSTVTTDDFYTLPSPAPQALRLVGETATTSDGTTTTSTYGANNGLVDVLPEVPGPVAPQNDAQLSVATKQADGSTISRATNADGTYVETGTFPDGTTSKAMANADGSGTYSFPLLGPNYPNTTFAVGAPQAVTSPTPGSVIPIAITYGNGIFPTPSPSPTSVVSNRTVAVWYLQPLVLSSQTLVDNGAAALPAACTVPPALQRSPHQLVATATTVDPIFGELETRTTTTYTEPGIGVACVQFADVVQQVYDFSGQTASLVRTVSTPQQVTTIAETLSLTSETVIGLSSTGRKREALAVAEPFAVPGAARFEALVAERRRERRATFAHAIVRGAL